MNPYMLFTLGLILSCATIYSILWGIDIGVYRKLWYSYIVTGVMIFFSIKLMIEGLGWA